MARAHAYLRSLLAGEGVAGRRPHWKHVHAILHAVTLDESEESHLLLRDVAVFEGTLDLDPRHGMPHSMPPEEMLRSVAVQTLGRWDRHRHRDVIGHVAAHAGTDHLVAIARVHLE
jgi:hypothetical protein